MRIPKYIDELLKKRAKYAKKFIDCDIEIVEWLEKNNITVSNDDISTGCMSMCEPFTSIENIRECIRKK